ncbi:aKG-HExxH-type peptide beta-hydroxylase [Rhizobium sullae]|uniref:aKG-HExxH-type peptide beta-hydroxylase n=1 Tax=Rhizobium sullae TaxID=50338 RepID=UPI000B363707
MTPLGNSASQPTTRNVPMPDEAVPNAGTFARDGTLIRPKTNPRSLPMSASRIQELADEARLLLKRNPLMASTVSLQRVATRNLLKRRFQYGRTLAAASKLADCSVGIEALAGYFPDLANGGYTRLLELPPAVAGPVGADPYRSSALAAWMGGLARSLEWQAARPDVQVVSGYLQPDLIASDLDLERQPACRLSCGIGLVRIESAARSPIMQALIRQCMPDYPRPDRPITDDAELDRIADHLEKAFALIAELDECGHQRLIAGLHTLHVGVRREPQCSFSSSNELPGSALIVLSRERLRDGDHAATAAQLLHEAANILLGFYTTSAAASLPGEFQYVSPYKNDLQTLESILHTAYTIPWECAMRMACLSTEADPERRARKTAFIIAYAARQVPLIDIARKGIERLGGDVLLDLPDIAAIPSWSGRILELVGRLLAEEPVAHRQAHLAERQRVLDRQAWDIGQMLLRGKEPIDPRMGRRQIDDSGDNISLWYNGKFHVIPKAADHAVGKDCDRSAATIRGIAPSEMEAM